MLYFLQTIQHIYEHESVILYNNIFDISDEETVQVVEFLRLMYDTESLDFPHDPVVFDGEAALWSAKTIYCAAQLILYRQHSPLELSKMLPAYQGRIDASSILSADLMLRFLPDLITNLASIDLDDALIAILQKILETWHYSGLKMELNIAVLDFNPMLQNQCLMQLYLDRIVQYKNLKLAELEIFQNPIKANFGTYTHFFWKEFIQ